jgi:hypothetical protein
VDRIEPMLALLREAWYRYPDQRLGQLVGNAARDAEDANVFGYGRYRDPFNVEDDEMWEGLKTLAKGEQR